MARKSTLFLVVFLLMAMLIAGCGKEESTAPPAAGDNSAQTSSTNGSDANLEELMAKVMQVEGMSYDMLTTGMGQTSTINVWQSGENVRMEFEIEGQKSIQIYNAKGEAYMIQPDQNMALKMTIEPELESASAWTEKEDNWKVVGSENCGGYNCLVVESKEDETLVKMWLRKDIGMPVKVENTDNAGEKFTVEFINVEIGKQDGSLFQVPPGMRITEM